MAILRFNFPSGLDAKKVARNMLSGLDLWATGAAVNAGKRALYVSALTQVPEVLTDEDRLQLPDQPRTIFNQEDRNAIRLRGESGIEAIFTGIQIHVQRNNTIVSTALVGRKGTVKEFIQAQDYQVTISGELTNHSVTRAPGAVNVDNVGAITAREINTKAFPIEQLRILINILDSEASIEAENVLLAQYGITSLALGSLDCPSGKFINTQPFKLAFKSDEDVDLYEIEDN